jgi:hypothetical protein
MAMHNNSVTSLGSLRRRSVGMAAAVAASCIRAAGMTRSSAYKAMASVKVAVVAW